MIIQFILIILAVVVLFVVQRNAGSSRASAWKKLLFIAFIGAMVVFIISPELLNTIARMVGVGRGADLVLYGLFFGFVLLSVNIYTKFQSQQQTIHRLARKVALLEAQKRKGKL